jgi:hypothetical protein
MATRAGPPASPRRLPTAAAVHAGGGGMHLPVDRASVEFATAWLCAQELKGFRRAKKETAKRRREAKARAKQEQQQQSRQQEQPRQQSTLQPAQKAAARRLRTTVASVVEQLPNDHSTDTSTGVPAFAAVDVSQLAADPPLLGQDKWLGGELSPTNGCIYAVPGSAPNVLKITPPKPRRSSVSSSLSDSVDDDSESSPSLSLVPLPRACLGSSLSNGRFKWLRGVAARDGCIYAIPANATAVLRIEPSDAAVGRGASRPSQRAGLTTGAAAAAAGAAPDAAVPRFLLLLQPLLRAALPLPCAFEAEAACWRANTHGTFSLTVFFFFFSFFQWCHAAVCLPHVLLPRCCGRRGVGTAFHAFVIGWSQTTP